MSTPSCPGRARPTRRARRSAAAADWSATLLNLASVLAEGARQGGCAFVGVSAAGGAAVDLHLQPAHPADLLPGIVGWRSPPGWLAAGMVAPAFVAEAGLRAGGATAVLARPDGSLVVGLTGRGPARAWVTPPGAGEGRLADLCRRVLAAPTPRCADPPRHAWAAPWLDRLVTRAVTMGAGTPLAWPEVARAHPLAAMLAPGTVPSPEDLARSAFLPPVQRSWEALRRAVVAGRPGMAELSGDLTPAEASWLDAGSFARRLLARHPSPGELLDALADLLPALLYTDVAAVAAAWDVAPGGQGPAVGPFRP